MNSSDQINSDRVNFGHKKVSPKQKTELVGEVFHKVAQRYDVMNDLMSFGTHRIFKRMVIEMSGVREGHKVLDLAGGTGDMSALFAQKVGATGAVVLTDLNQSMMSVGRDRLLDAGCAQVQFCLAPAESLPFAEATFDCACISFGLRNFTDKDGALGELLRVLRPGGTLIVLEFSKPENPVIKTAYNAFQALWPTAGQALVGESAPYQYLVDSIEVHPDQRALKQMFEDAGFMETSYHNLIGGVAAIHRGRKPLD